ncbi:hypothetical protein OA92_22740 [Marinomonas sp. SBI22]|uniref:molybdenum cofactor guanylyltransferase n=1 Tax=unclassified Marinomonas TaxID=196814 RepID=UPI0007AF891F|nr:MULTISPECIES: molybdenum cofactor guanylyltransferase [unclassified Marinomonas]KZM38620.1 hypothetical protein OA92_22740 [Marinomonas sp. SBI22]KZM39164.1 hypothetical protein OA91_22590 [Marinomonas sp. SBI8L]
MSVSVLGVILAGGQASRMNYVAKGLTRYKDRVLIEYALKSFETLAEYTLINANKDTKAYQNLGVKVFADEADCLERGPLSGVYAALLQAQKLGVSHLLLSPCDTPLVTQAVFERLKSEAEKEPDCAFYIESDSGIQPLHAILPVAGMAARLKRYLENEARVMLFYRQLGAKAVFWQEEQVFLNINYLEQLEG